MCSRFYLSVFQIHLNGQIYIILHTDVASLQGSLSVEVEELERSNPISLSVERKRGTFGRLTVHWAANGSLEDIFPTSGVVRLALSLSQDYLFHC